MKEQILKIIKNISLALYSVVIIAAFLGGMVFLMIRLSGDKPYHNVPRLMEQLFDRNPNVRYRAVTALGKTKDPRAIHALIMAGG